MHPFLFLLSALFLLNTNVYAGNAKAFLEKTYKKHADLQKKPLSEQITYFQNLGTENLEGTTIEEITKELFANDAALH